MIFFNSQVVADVGPIDPHMERQVETINKLVSSYMQIVAKMTRDYIPKAIMFNIVQNVNITFLDLLINCFMIIF